jgi:hypothetical protein
MRSALWKAELTGRGATVSGDLYNKGERFSLRIGMEAATLHAIHDFIQHVVPSVTQHRRALRT